MGRGVKRTLRRGAAVFALLGVAFYALLLPWHLTSQFNLQLFAAEFGADALRICSSAADGTTEQGAPVAPSPSCPICKGLASFHFAIAAQPQVLALAPLGRAPLAVERREHLTGTPLPAPRSRGPPLPA